jgi:hypothetical protein
MKQRPTNAKPGDKPLPITYRAEQAGVLVYTPTAADIIKLAMGYAIRVRVHQAFQHNPGKIQVGARWDVIENRPGEDAPKVETLKEGK